MSTTPTPPQAALPPALLRDHEAAAYIGVSTRKLWQMASAGDAPAPVRLPGSRSSRWRRDDLDQWVAQLTTP